MAGDILILAAIEGQRFIIHAHGDNNKTWKKILAEWMLFQCLQINFNHQTNEELFGMSNFGGFTDGDRALCFAIWAGVKSENIELIGFSTKKIGKWSGVTDQNKKLKKLLWMEKIVSMFKLEDQID